jgi:hypothetical protein
MMLDPESRPRVVRDLLGSSRVVEWTPLVKTQSFITCLGAKSSELNKPIVTDLYAENRLSLQGTKLDRACHANAYSL